MHDQPSVCDWELPCACVHRAEALLRGHIHTVSHSTYAHLYIQRPNVCVYMVAYCYVFSVLSKQCGYLLSVFLQHFLLAALTSVSCTRS